MHMVRSGPRLAERSDRRCPGSFPFHPHRPHTHTSALPLHVTSTSITCTLDQFSQYLSQYPALQSLYATMRTYITPKILLLLVFGLLLVARGVTSDEKTPPSTLQIGIILHSASFLVPELRDFVSCCCSPFAIDFHCQDSICDLIDEISLSYTFLAAIFKSRNQTPCSRRTLHS